MTRQGKEVHPGMAGFRCYVILPLLLMTSLVLQVDCSEKCPVETCVCSNETLPFLDTMVFLLNCSNGRMPSFLNYLPKDRHLYPWQYRGSYFPKFSGAWAKIGALDISINDLSNLKHAGFTNFTELGSLDLSQNHIGQILESALVGLRNLSVLNISHNSISYIEKGSLNELSNLLVLDLDDNRMYTVEEGTFQDLSNLQHLSLRSNGLTAIDGEAFSSLVNLRALSLANNQLKALVKRTFIGLDRLAILDLGSNLFTTVPGRTLAQLTNLNNLILDNNPIKSLMSLSFNSLPLRTLRMNFMPYLKLVERFSFVDLPFLHSIELSFSPQLMYISPVAFQNVTALQVLDLRHNALQTLSPDILKCVPSLKLLFLADNPLLCDCNIHWIREIMDQGKLSDSSQNQTVPLIEGDIRNEPTQRTLNPETFMIQDAEILKCASPKTFKKVSVFNISLASIPNTCSPTILSSFETNYQESVGASFKLRCIAVGNPEPKIHWITPTNKVLNTTTNDSRFFVSNPGTIQIAHIKPEDSGSYGCRALNSLGYDQRATVLKVHSNDIHLLIKAMAPNFVTLTWNGSESTITTSDYVIMYRKSGPDIPYSTVPLHPYMRAYTFAQLTPQTLYEFCIAYEDLDRNPSPINCRKVRTKHRVYVISGIKSANGAKAIISVTVIAFIIAFLCVFSAACRNYKKRKDYEDPESTDGRSRGRSGKDVQHLSQIPLDNLYRTPSTSIPSTPMYTSTTSLISNSKA